MLDYWRPIAAAWLVVGLAAACNVGPASTTTAGGGPLTLKVQQAYDAFSKGDRAALLALCTADVTWEAAGPAEAPGLYGKFTGPDAVGEWFTALEKDAETGKEIGTPKYIEEGDTVVRIGTRRTVYRNGSIYESPYVHVFTFRDGKIARWQGFEDTAGRMAAMKGQGRASAEPAKPAKAEPDTR